MTPTYGTTRKLLETVRLLNTAGLGTLAPVHDSIDFVSFCWPGPRVPGATFEVLHQGVQTAETNKLPCAQVL
jgi:hypothetical protein